ncbi:MAG: hypothetical protein KJ645_09300 [Planctomycetes bacterium]|nr:hypothetical protein [Planctomycetota bacterium]
MKKEKIKRNEETRVKEAARSWDGQVQDEVDGSFPQLISLLPLDPHLAGASPPNRRPPLELRQGLRSGRLLRK